MASRKQKPTPGKALPLPPIRLIWLPFQRFAALESAAGLLLLICTIIALIWANSPLGASYEAIKTFPISLHLGSFAAEGDALLFVNDVLMSIFFLMAGLEIKREMLAGELASLRKSLLPISGAIGGMIVPALIYMVMTHGKIGSEGWGVPMATDIAFALGAMMALGKRVPTALKVFLVALAIIDDIGAILVIAIFYSGEIHWLGLGLAAVVMLVAGIMNKEGIHHPIPYLVCGIILWFALHHGGVHATLAGVLLAITIPHRPKVALADFSKRAQANIDAFVNCPPDAEPALLDEERVRAIRNLENDSKMAEPLLQQLEGRLHPFVSFIVIPLFALVNAGVAVSSHDLHTLFDPVSLGIILGLCVGKPIGITAAAWLAVRFRFGQLPDGVTWAQMLGAGILGGIGFTMSLFVAHLGLEKAGLLNEAKLAILVASTLATLVGVTLLVAINKRRV